MSFLVDETPRDGDRAMGHPHCLFSFRSTSYISSTPFQCVKIGRTEMSVGIARTYYFSYSYVFRVYQRRKSRQPSLVSVSYRENVNPFETFCYRHALLNGRATVCLFAKLDARNYESKKGNITLT